MTFTRFNRRTSALSPANIEHFSAILANHESLISMVFCNLERSLIM